jgi:hypothetical protein
MMKQLHTASTRNRKRESERGHTRTRHRDEYTESVDLTVYSQTSSSCSARTLPGYGPGDQTPLKPNFIGIEMDLSYRWRNGQNLTKSATMSDNKILPH